MPRKIISETVMEFPSIGRYRVRLLRRFPDGDDHNFRTLLDVREYVERTGFVGYTFQGIRLTTLDQVRTLRDVLDEIARTGCIVEGQPESSTSAK